jgi:transmembrane sensor
MGITRRARREIAGEAVDWFLQFQERAASGPDRQGFSEWLLRSPAHVEEYLRVSCSWSLADVAAAGDLEAAALVAAAKAHHETDNVVALPSRLSRRSLSSGNVPGSGPARALSGRTWRAALVASLVLGIALSITWLSWQSPMTFQTVVGEQSSFTLQDGSVVFLNTNSKVRIGWLPTERHIELVRGEARFKVARDASRPFTVATATAAVRALGTVFNVRAEPLSTQVAVLEGQVEVTVARPAEPAFIAPASANEDSTAVQAPAIERVRLAAGERAAVTRGGIQTNAGPPIEAVMAWTERRLVFQDQPLDTVLEEFNRYRTHPLVLDDPPLAALRISGVFDLSDPESLIAYLGTYEAVRVDRRGDGSQHLFRGSAGVDARK